MSLTATYQPSFSIKSLSVAQFDYVESQLYVADILSFNTSVSLNVVFLSGQFQGYPIVFPSDGIVDGLVGWWTFDEGRGSYAYDYSGNGNTGTLVNGPTWVPGKFGGALQFNGVNQYVSIPYNSVFDLTSAGSVSLWVNIAQFTTTFQTIIEHGSGGSIRWFIAVSNNNKFYLSTGNGSSYNQQWSVISPLTGTWYHIVATWDGSTQQLYVNGMLDSSKAMTASITPISTPLGIGERPITWDGPFNGIIDDVRIYNRALSASEIFAIYQASITPRRYTLRLYSTSTSVGTYPVYLIAKDSINEGLVGYWSFDEGQGNIAYDYSGYNNHGTLVNLPTWVSGKFSGALQFNAASTQYVNLPASPNWYNLNSLSYTFWFYITDISSAQAVLGTYNNANNWTFYRDATWSPGYFGSLAYYLRNDTALTSSLLIQATFSSNTWNHVAVSLQASGNTASMMLYVNGQFLSSQTVSNFTSWYLDTTQPLQIGKAPGWSALNGIIDDVRIWNKVLTGSQILTLYSNGPSIQGPKIDAGVIRVWPGLARAFNIAWNPQLINLGGNQTQTVAITVNAITPSPYPANVVISFTSPGNPNLITVSPSTLTFSSGFSSQTQFVNINVAPSAPTAIYTLKALGQDSITPNIQANSLLIINVSNYISPTAQAFTPFTLGPAFYDLGSATMPWQRAFINQIYTGAIFFTSNPNQPASSWWTSAGLTVQSGAKIALTDSSLSLTLTTHRTNPLAAIYTQKQGQPYPTAVLDDIGLALGPAYAPAASYLTSPFSGTITGIGDLSLSIGYTSYRLYKVRSYILTAGDLGFEESLCIKCGKPFRPGQRIILKVHRTKKGETLTKPVHLRCPR